MDTKKKWIVGVITVVVIGAVIWWGTTQDAEAPNIQEGDETLLQLDTEKTTNISESLDVKNAHYTIESRKIAIRDGIATESNPGSVSTIKTSVLEGPAFADMDGDGRKDAVAILRDEPGGTGIFYYASVLLANSNPLVSTNAILLGDRIRIKEISISGNKISIVILDRNEGEAMVTPPSLKKTINLEVVEGSLVKTL